MPTRPSFQGWAAIQSITAAASAPSCSSGTMAARLRPLPRV
jgi:hypothetical protein